MDIGIDLGTTFSVMAVKGRMEMAPGYPPGEYLGDKGMDVTILPDLVGNHLFPSVFWWEPIRRIPTTTPRALMRSVGTPSRWPRKQVADYVFEAQDRHE